MIRILLSSKLGERRMSQAKLARLANVRPNTINDLYHELTSKVDLDQLDRICKVLDCDLSEILVMVPDPDNSSTR